MNYIDQIAALGACPGALDWLRGSNHPTPEIAWNACSRADWMIWLVARSQTEQTDRQALVLCICDIAETALIYIPAGEDRPRTAIETARRWARGEATEDEVRDAAMAAYACAAHSFVFVVVSVAAATKAAAYTAFAQNNVTAAFHAAEAVVFATRATATAAEAAAPADVTSTHFTSATDTHYANIVRRHFPNPPNLESA